MRGGNVMMPSRFGHGAYAWGNAMAAINKSWNRGSVAVSILVTLRTAVSISRRWMRDNRVFTAPAPAALPTERTPVTGQSGTNPSTMAYTGSICAPNAPAKRMSSTSGLPACSTNKSIPARSAALANWIARISFCVINILTSPCSYNTYENVRSSATTRGVLPTSDP